ncbi:MAG: cohesin domain-containing protein [Halorubrum sp.]
MSRRARVVAAALLCAVLVAGLTAPVGPAVAGDNPGLLGFDPDTAAADPGETVEVNVWFRAMGGYDDDGVVAYEYTLAYDPNVLTAVGVEPGPWLERGEETSVRHGTAIDRENGTVTVAAERDPPAGGVGDTAADRTPTATITFEVPDDAPATDAVVGIADADAQLLQYPLPVLTTREAVIEVAGGGDERGPSGDERGDVARFDETTENTEADDDRDDPEHFTLGAILALGVAALGVLVVRAVRRLR